MGNRNRHKGLGPQNNFGFASQWGQADGRSRAWDSLWDQILRDVLSRLTEQFDAGPLEPKEEGAADAMRDLLPSLD